MRAYVIYESMFGNTEVIASQVALGLSDSFDTTVVEVGDAPDRLPDGIDLLVIGGPTHAFGMSRPDSRTAAARETRSPLVSRRGGIREWIAARTGTERLPFATFSTKVRGPFPGSAGKSALNELSDKGFGSVAAPEAFRVDGKTGPLLEGEVDRARDWGHHLGSQIVAAGHVSRRPQ